MRTLTFTLITDSRSDNDIAGLMKDRKRKILSLLKKMEGVTVTHDVERQLSWKEGAEQYRCHFYVRKEGRKTTWNDIYKAVNSVKPVPYKFLKEGT